MLPGEEIKDLPGATSVQEALFSAPLAAPVVNTPLTVLEGIVVTVLLERAAPSPEEKEQQMEVQRHVLLNIKQDDAFSLFMNDQQVNANIQVTR